MSLSHRQQLSHKKTKTNKKGLFVMTLKGNYGTFYSNFFGNI